MIFMSKYPVFTSGEWIVPDEEFKFCCCDCGLVHQMRFGVLQGNIIMQVRRDNKATAGVRRGKRYKK